MESGLCEEIPLMISNVIKEGKLPCPSYISITAQKVEKLEYLMFQNFYVSAISIQQLGRDNRWVTVLNDFRLTNFPHFENDSENWYIIPASFFNENFLQSYFKEIRIYLNQPSPNWKEFTLKNISCFTIREKPLVKKVEPISAFSKLKDKLQETFEVLNSNGGNEVSSYEETLNGVIEISRLDVMASH